jgi:hypothetical protein
MGVLRNTTYKGSKINNIFFDFAGSQAVLARASGRSNFEGA